jgi:glycosyltransferase involved in cell wall biosynthesis
MFVIGGTGAEKSNLQKIAKDLGISKNVKFLGFVPDKEMPEFYHMGDCFVIAGTAELQSIVTLEAMASGLPVIAVNAVALPELVKHKQNGYLFDINSPKHLASYIFNILSNKKLRQQMSEQSLKIIEKHDIKNTVKQFEKLYEKLIKE